MGLEKDNRFLPYMDMAAILGHVTQKNISINFVPPPPPKEAPHKIGFHWTSSLREQFENNGHIHVYSPGAGADNPLGSKFFHKHNYSVNLAASFYH